jgi:similar to stage IV sporulation protein
MEVYEGAAVVKPGDTVHKGQLLVSGIVDSKTVGARFVHASAKVLGRTWRNIDIIEPLYEVKRTPTGNSIAQNRLKIGNITINLYLNSGNPYENYDKMDKIKDLKIFGAQLPFTMSTTTYSEVKETKTPVSPEQAISKAEKKLADTVAKESLTTTILKQDKLIETKGDSMILRATLECSEEIAITESISIENNK